MFDLQMEKAQAAAAALHIDLKTSVVTGHEDLWSHAMTGSSPECAPKRVSANIPDFEPAWHGET
jgi:hypothetical protein